MRLTRSPAGWRKMVRAGVEKGGQSENRGRPFSCSNQSKHILKRSRLSIIFTSSKHCADEEVAIWYTSCEFSPTWPFQIFEMVVPTVLLSWDRVQTSRSTQSTNIAVLMLWTASYGHSPCLRTEVVEIGEFCHKLRGDSQSHRIDLVDVIIEFDQGSATKKNLQRPINHSLSEEFG
jgi:hypothetical protein